MRNFNVWSTVIEKKSLSKQNKIRKQRQGNSNAIPGIYFEFDFLFLFRYAKLYPRILQSYYKTPCTVEK